MKRTSYFIVTAAVCTLASVAAPTVISRLKVADPVKVLMPVLTDSVDNKGVKYDPAKLLDNNMTLDFKRLKTTVAQADTAGFISLAPAADGYNVVLVQTPIRAQRYATGKLQVTAPSQFEVLVGEESKAKKTTVEDSITDQSTQSVSLALEPERDYDITVKVLTEKGNIAAPAVKVEFVPDKGFEDIEIYSAPSMKRRFYVDNCVDGTRVASTNLSPDGKYLIARYKEYLSPNNYRTYSTIVETATGNTVTGNLPYSAQWMPKGNRLYYTEKGRVGNTLFTLSVPDMKTTRLMERLESESVTFAPDESYFLYYRRSEGEPEKGIMRRITSPDDRQPGNRDKYALVKQDVASGNSITLTYGNQNTYMLDISPDSRKLLYYVTRETPDKWPFYANTLIEMDMTSLATDTIFADEGSFNGAVYSPDGRQLLVMGGPSMLGGVNLNCGNHPIPNDFDVQAAILNLGDRKVLPVTKDFDPSLQGTPVWNKADGNIYFLGETGFSQFLYRYSPKTGKFDKLDTKVDFVRNFSMGDKNAALISYVGSSSESDGSAWLYNVRKKANTLVDDPFDATIGDIEWGKTSKWTFTASDGTEIDGEITLPPGFDPDRKYPLIVYYYGGTSPSSHRIDHPYNANVFASRDYVIYILNPSGTTGYGQEFSARHVNAWGKRTADDIIEGVKAFCKAHPFVDEKKIGCLGASYGGFMTQYLQTKTDIFAAAVSHAGISDVTSYWGEGYWGYSYNSVAAAKSYPWTDPELFTKQGSLFNADKIHTPLLLLHGTEDTNVPIGESIQIFNALKILGRDVEFITVDGANHVVTDPDKRRVWQNTIMAWFAKYLQDSPEWWDSMYGKK